MHRVHRSSRALHRPRHAIRDTRLVLVNRGRPIRTQDLLIADVALAGPETVGGHLLGVFLPVADAPFGKQVQLDHHDFVDGAEEGDLPSPLQLRVRHQCLDEDVLDVPHAGVDVDELDVEGVHAFLAAVHHPGGSSQPGHIRKQHWRGYQPDFIQIPPEVHAGRVLAQPDEVPAQEHLAPPDLRGVFVEVVLVQLGLVDGGLVVEGPGGDVALKQFLVDQVDDGGDELLEEFGSAGQSFDVGWGMSVSADGAFAAK